MTSLAKSLLTEDVSVASKSHDHPCPPPFQFRSWVSWRTLKHFWMMTAAHPHPPALFCSCREGSSREDFFSVSLVRTRAARMSFPLNYSKSHHTLQTAGSQVDSASLSCCLVLCTSPGGF